MVWVIELWLIHVHLSINLPSVCWLMAFSVYLVRRVPEDRSVRSFSVENSLTCRGSTSNLEALIDTLLEMRHRVAKGELLCRRAVAAIWMCYSSRGLCGHVRAVF